MTDVLNPAAIKPARLTALITVALWLMVGCNFVRTDAVAATSTTVRVIVATNAESPQQIETSSPVPTLNAAARTMQPISTATLAATNTPSTNMLTEDGCEASAGQPGAAHIVTADVDYAAHTVRVDHRVHVINRTNDLLADVVLNIEPNRWAGVFMLESVLGTYNGNPFVTAYEATGRRLRVELAAPIEPGCGVELQLVYVLQIPPVGQGVSSLTGYLGYTARQLNLGHWLATIAVRRGSAWVSHDVAQIGEQIVSETANWDVTFNVANAPVELHIAAPGRLERPDGDTWRFVLIESREFSASMSDQFNIIAQESTSGTMIEVYTFDDAVINTANGVIDGAAHVLLIASRSLSMYSDLFGEYPYERFLIVEGDFSDGMEFSGLVFVGRDWFRTFTGEPTGYLTIITVHEVAHQWWYARVGSDQAETPWLDEALATYSEYIFFEEYYPALRDWWWSFRVGTFVPADFTGRRVNSTVYEFSTIREYINAVYLRGAQMLHALREDIGTDPFFNWLHAYSQAGAGRVVSPDVFWSLLTDEQRELTRETREAYLSSVLAGFP